LHLTVFFVHQLTRRCTTISLNKLDRIANLSKNCYFITTAIFRYFVRFRQKRNPLSLHISANKAISLVPLML